MKKDGAENAEKKGTKKSSGGKKFANRFKKIRLIDGDSKDNGD